MCHLGICCILRKGVSCHEWRARQLCQGFLLKRRCLRGQGVGAGCYLQSGPGLVEMKGQSVWVRES